MQAHHRGAIPSQNVAPTGRAAAQGTPEPVQGVGGGWAAIVAAGSPLRKAPGSEAGLGPRRGGSHRPPAAAVQQASPPPTKHTLRRRAAENATAQLSPTHLRPWVSHFSDGQIAPPLSLPPAAASAAVAADAADAAPAAAAAAAATATPFPPSPASLHCDPPLRVRRRRDAAGGKRGITASEGRACRSGPLSPEPLSQRPGLPSSRRAGCWEW